MVCQVTELRQANPYLSLCLPDAYGTLHPACSHTLSIAFTLAFKASASFPSSPLPCSSSQLQCGPSESHPETTHSLLCHFQNGPPQVHLAPIHYHVNAAVC